MGCLFLNKLKYKVKLTNTKLNHGEARDAHYDNIHKYIYDIYLNLGAILVEFYVLYITIYHIR
jgi:hypothetical protein